MDKSNILQTFLSAKNSHEILNLLEVIDLLLTRYGKKLTMPYFLEGLKKVDKDLVDIIYILDAVWILKARKLSSFIREFKKESAQERSTFTLKTNDKKVIKPLEQYLKKKFWKYYINYEEVSSDNLTVDMKWHGYSFKRSLETDIDKLLS